jgi:nitrate/nitrite transporter NarK
LGTALGVQAGIGNFGVSLVQLLSPLIIGLSIFSFMGGGEIIAETGKTIYLENIAFIYIIPLFFSRNLGVVFIKKHSCGCFFQRANGYFWG